MALKIPSLTVSSVPWAIIYYKTGSVFLNISHFIDDVNRQAVPASTCTNTSNILSPCITGSTATLRMDDSLRMGYFIQFTRLYALPTFCH